jgi:hypothetical protein
MSDPKQEKAVFVDALLNTHIRTNVKHISLDLPLAYMEFLPEKGKVRNICNQEPYVFTLMDESVRLHKSPKYAFKHDNDALCAVGNMPRTASSRAKKKSMKRMEKYILPGHDNSLDYYIDQAVALRKAFPYTKNTNNQPTLSEIGVEGKHHVCSHITIQNSFAYQSRLISHRLLAGHIFIPERNNFYAHAAIEIPTMKGPMLIDPTRIAKQFLEQGVHRDDIKHTMLNPDRQFYEQIDFSTNARIPLLANYLRSIPRK